MSAALAGMLLLGSPAVLASFLASAEAVSTFTTDTLAPPAELAVQGASCQPDGTASITLGWVATTSDWADGYDVMVATAAGGPYGDTRRVDGRTTTTAVVEGLEPSTDYWFVAVATSGTWQSTASNETGTTTPTCA